jgi:putative endonuclease
LFGDTRQAEHAGMPIPTPTPDPRQALGRRGEELAAQHLERLGFRIVARNYRTRHGELDLVAFDDVTLVFAEVKTRRHGSGTPWDSLHVRKRAQVRRMASAYLNREPDRPRGGMLRFDAIGVVLRGDGTLVGLEHLEGAF